MTISLMHRGTVALPNGNLVFDVEVWERGSTAILFSHGMPVLVIRNLWKHMRYRDGSPCVLVGYIEFQRGGELITLDQATIKLMR